MTPTRTGPTKVTAIDAIGIEDLFYDETNRVAAEERAWRLSYLRQLRDSGKLVLVVDFRNAADTERELDELRP